MFTTEIEIRTPAHQSLVPVTDAVTRALAGAVRGDGVLHLAVMHTTCGLLINENADPDVAGDLLRRLEQMVPWHDGADRHAEGNTAAHLRSVLVGSSVSVPARDGRPLLGTWQGIFLAEFDGPRRRTLALTLLD